MIAQLKSILGEIKQRLFGKPKKKRGRPRKDK